MVPTAARPGGRPGPSAVVAGGPLVAGRGIAAPRGEGGEGVVQGGHGHHLDAVGNAVGIAVGETARGAGVGSALLAEILAIARRAGKRAVRLDVVDTNPRAKALYLRCGFVEEGRRRLDFLRPIFGFASVTTMRHHLGRADGSA